MTAAVQEIEFRLNALERQNRRLRVALCLLTISVTAVMGMGFRRAQAAAGSIPASPEMQAQRFVLVDSAGHERAVLGLGPNGPFLHFLASDSTAVPTSIDTSGVILRGRSGISAALVADGVELESAGSHAEFKAWALKIQPASSRASAQLEMLPAGPSLLLQDASGGLAAVGVHSFVPPHSAVTRRTSAASIALVSPDHRILWSAPPPRR